VVRSRDLWVAGVIAGEDYESVCSRLSLFFVCLVAAAGPRMKPNLLKNGSSRSRNFNSYIGVNQEGPT